MLSSHPPSPPRPCDRAREPPWPDPGPSRPLARPRKLARAIAVRSRRVAYPAAPNPAMNSAVASATALAGPCSRSRRSFGATASPGDPVCVGRSSRMIKATHGEADQWEVFKGGHMILTRGRRSAARWLSRGHRAWRAPVRRRHRGHRVSARPRYPAHASRRPWRRSQPIHRQCPNRALVTARRAARHHQDRHRTRLG